MGWKAAQKLIQNWRVLRGDNVMIIRGKDKGETGIIKRVIRSQNRVLVEGQNLVKKHIKQGQGHEGGIFTVEAPLHASNVQVLDPVTGKPCKVGIRYLEDGNKVRISRGIGASGSIIPRPEILKIRTTPRPTIVGPKDTLMDLVMEKTFDAKAGKGMPNLCYLQEQIKRDSKWLKWVAVAKFSEFGLTQVLASVSLVLLITGSTSCTTLGSKLASSVYLSYNDHRTFILLVGFDAATTSTDFEK
ncbi:hypothetical protein HHK36_026755 [Tetracentron sinense]|uniref:KOW domain-containing protein n=1 Tax=Tetracentron sinense TaxID=13715 RepID=A0A834YGI9_TETSI|nr:hypothetical protein HHK36_026755 [Tetracentron sinense]